MTTSIYPPKPSPVLSSALKTSQPNPYVPQPVPFVPYTPPGGYQGVPAGVPTVPSTPDNPAGIPQTPAPSTPPATGGTPTPPAPAPTSYQGVQIGDYTADPILIRTKALSQQQVADAQAAASAATKNALTGYGYEAGSDQSLYPDQNTLLAAENNPYSTLATLGYNHTQRVHGLEENVNNANLWYSGEHAKELGTEGRQYLGERASASSALANLLSQIQSGVLNAQRGAEAQNLSAEESALQRALQWALDHPGSTPPGSNPSGDFMGVPGAGSFPSATPTPGNPAGVPQPPYSTTPGTISPGQPGYNQLPSSATRAALVAGGGINSLFNAPYPDDTRSTAGSTAGSTAAGTGGATFNFVRNSTSLPGNAAPAGTPALYNADDPLAAKNVAASGGTAGIWAPVHVNETPQAYAARIAQLAATNPATLMLDLEAESKGYPGTAGYEFPAQVMSALQAAGVKAPISVTVAGGGEDDFNYQPFVQSGAMIWIQTYGTNPGPDNIDPQTAYNKMIARGVPPSQIGLVLAPGQQGIPGVPSALYTIDDAPTLSTQSYKGTVAPASAPAPTPEQKLISQGATPNALINAPAPAPAPAPTLTQTALTTLLSPYFSPSKRYN